MKFQPVKPKKISIQIAEQIRSPILNGDFSPGDKLPPERELAEMFSSRVKLLHAAVVEFRDENYIPAADGDADGRAEFARPDSFLPPREHEARRAPRRARPGSSASRRCG
mgnify:CR=1 FL=1